MRRTWAFLTRQRFLAFLVAALVVACSSATLSTRDSIRFSHHVHNEQGMECGDCHPGLEEDAEKKVYHFLKMEGCADCHDVEDEKECAKCHTNTQAPDTYDRVASTHLRFSHQLHQGRWSDCGDCHVGAAMAADVSERNRLMPGHLECNKCHQKDMDFGRCRLCHERLDLNPRLPTKEFYSHKEGFFDRHGAKAAADGGENCQVCHDQSFCVECHDQRATVRPSLRYQDRVDRNFIHRGDWISRHAIEARLADATCIKCHGTGYCSSCHERSGVGGHLGKNPHPPGWMTPGTAQSHSRAARRRIQECATCHDQGAASNCVRCHAQGGVNPHPPGWVSPVDSGERADHKMCRICHDS